MVSKLDQSVGEVVTALRQKGMLENSIVLFMSDNGAPTVGIHSNRGSNYPMRGVGVKFNEEVNYWDGFIFYSDSIFSDEGQSMGGWRSRCRGYMESFDQRN